MLKLYRPTYILDNVLKINIEKLISLNINAIFFDLDNTLACPYMVYPSNEMKIFLNSFSKYGIDVFICSNNHEERVKKFCKDLNVKYFFELKKPQTKKLIENIKKYNLDTNKILYVGDQVMTDVLIANKLNIKVCLVNPLTKIDEPITFIPRLLDKFFRNILNLKNGEVL